MTAEEAKKDINYIIKELNKRRMTPCGFCTMDKCTPVLSECTPNDFVINKAIEALEKQIPKRPTGSYPHCPYCNSDMIEIWMGGGFSETQLNYCPNCGQAIDWSDENDG